MTKQTEALRMAIELMERFLEHDSISSSDYIDVRNACQEALAQPTIAQLDKAREALNNCKGEELDK